MVTSSGYVVQPGITIPGGAQSITIGSDGTVSVKLLVAEMVSEEQLTDKPVQTLARIGQGKTQPTQALPS